MGFPQMRMRRLRSHLALRQMVQETRLSPADFVMPLFVCPGQDVRREISSMPEQYQWSVDRIAEKAQEIAEVGVPAVLLFGIPESKDALGTRAYAEDAVVCRAVEKIKTRCPSLIVITDVCLCEYTDHGHCGVIKTDPSGHPYVDNDATLELLAREALAYARAGADVVAPSDMMDGRVGVIRKALDEKGFHHVAIMAYSAKYASAFYGPFREAAGSAPQFGDRTQYQMDPPNLREALREIALDIEEGADIVMVKPALAYLDVIRAASDRFDVPLAAYQVSGEYAMVKAAAARGWLDEKRVGLEILTAIRRAGAKIIITYWAEKATEWLNTNCG